MDPSRAAELTDLIQRIDAEIPINPELLALVDQALTHISSGRARNLERLEFLGDAVLRLAATEFIDRHHTDLAVGASSNLRAQLVSDRWLADVGAALGIEQHLVLGRHAQGDRSAEPRLRADATEALIGALYSSLGDFDAIHRWLTPIGMPLPKRCWPHPTSSTAKQPCRSGARARGWDYPTTPPKNAATNTAILNASAAR